MSSNEPFIRTAELVVGPLTESEGGGARDSALVIKSSGDRNGLRISYQINKTLASGPNTSVVSVYNMSRDTMKRLRTPSLKVNLFTGWQNTGQRLLSSGALLSSVITKEGPDTILTMQFFDGYDSTLKAVTNKTFEKGVNISQVLRAIVGDMPGVQVDEIDVEGVVGYSGLTISGSSARELDKLAESYGFSWSIQNGEFQAIKDNSTIKQDSKIVISSKLKNLIEVAPVLEGPLQIEFGVSIRAIIDNRVRPGNWVTVESEVNPSLNGNYKVFMVDFIGDTHSDQNEMAITSYKGAV